MGNSALRLAAGAKCSFVDQLKSFSTYVVLGIGVVLSGLPSLAVGPTIIGPIPYRRFSDSPFNGLSFDYFYLEDFEDATLNVPGVTPSSGSVSSSIATGPIVDSVENWPQGDSFFSDGLTGLTELTFTFSEIDLGSLPTHAGLVWTDGINDILFEGFDKFGNSLGTAVGSHAGTRFNDGDQEEDRFYGAVYSGGISAIKIRSGSGEGIEIDHLQYGGPLQQPPSTSVPAPLPVLGAAAAFGYSRKLRKRIKSSKLPVASAID